MKIYNSCCSRTGVDMFQQEKVCQVNLVPEQETGIIERGCNNPTKLVNFESTEWCRHRVATATGTFHSLPFYRWQQKRGALAWDSAGAWPWRSSSLRLEGYSIVRHLLSSHVNRCRSCRPLEGFKRDFHPKQVPLAQQRKETVVTGFFLQEKGCGCSNPNSSLKI